MGDTALRYAGVSTDLQGQRIAPDCDHSLNALPVRRNRYRRRLLLLCPYGACTDIKNWCGVLDALCPETGARSAAVQAIRVHGSQVRGYWTAHDSWLARFS